MRNAEPIWSGENRDTMIRFFKDRILDAWENRTAWELGRLEFELMAILWSRGESNVREVSAALERPLAYTTVMTTLDRLYKKGLLIRRMPERAFVYEPRLSREEWERERTLKMVANLFPSASPSRELLVSSFLDAVERHDSVLLDELEKKIRAKRKELSRRNRP